MKTYTLLYIRSIVVAIVFFAFAGRLAAQQQYDPTSVTQEVDYVIDELGDAQMELRMKMTAAQWINFKSSMVAQNPTVFMRNLERSMTGMLLEDFKNELNESSRSSVTKLKARNMATYKGDGKWELKLELKDPNITKISDHVYLLSGNLLSGGGVIQQLQKLFFPTQATNIKQDTDTYGNAIFTYQLHVEKSQVNFLLFIGIALILLGIAIKIIYLHKEGKLSKL